MTTPTPTPEAVEAAIIWTKGGLAEMSQHKLRLLHEYNGQPSMGASWNAMQILAAEVERLRGELERAEQKIEADRIARDHIIAKGVALEKELALTKLMLAITRDER